MQCMKQNGNGRNGATRLAGRVRLALFAVFLMTVAFNVVTSLLLRDRAVKVPAIVSSKEAALYDPYAQNGFWLKGCFHVHTDAHPVTPERHTPHLVASSYRERGYDVLAISDYNQITDGARFFPYAMPSYEWGHNLIKRHALVLGAEEVVPDYFPLFAFRENVQWSLHRLSGSGAFVAINHPLLFGAFTDEDLVSLDGYQGVEIFSPFGDVVDLYDRILSAGRPVFPLASDDLHYLPAALIAEAGEPFYKRVMRMAANLEGREGEAFLRYNYVLSRSRKAEHIKEALCRGSFVAVREYLSGFGQRPIHFIGVQNGEVRVKLDKAAQQIDFIGPGGEVLKRVQNTNAASFAVTEIESYVRIDIQDLRGRMLSSPFFRHDGSLSNGLCREAAMAAHSDEK